MTIYIHNTLCELSINRPETSAAGLLLQTSTRLFACHAPPGSGPQSEAEREHLHLAADCKRLKNS